MKIPRTPPDPRTLVATDLPDRLTEHMRPAADDGKYRHWDTFRHLTPPEGLTSEQWWLAVKLARWALSKALPLRTVEGRPFMIAMPDAAWEMVHRIDQGAGGRIAAADVIANPQTRARYVVSSLIEEAITSSQLEGASTTRVIAKEMLRSGRPPRDRSERMIVNNFRGMEHIRDIVDRPLTPDTVLDLHRILTEGTLDRPESAGRLQGPHERRVGVYDTDGQLLHRPPPADELPERMQMLCAFANGDVGIEGFLHPVVRAILVHFWLAYDHPFEDGNGRTARALFYWSMLRQGYWLADFLSISRILRQAPSRYGRSFLYTETDDGDTTYFVLYQLSVVCRAIDELHAYLERKTHEIQEIEAAIRHSDSFNHRQLALLRHALRHPGARYTFRSHARSHNVTHEAARRDLRDLASRGFLRRGKVGREHTFTPVDDLASRLGT